MEARLAACTEEEKRDRFKYPLFVAGAEMVKTGWSEWDQVPIVLTDIMAEVFGNTEYRPAQPCSNHVARLQEAEYDLGEKVGEVNRAIHGCEKTLDRYENSGLILAAVGNDSAKDEDAG